MTKIHPIGSSYKEFFYNSISFLRKHIALSKTESYVPLCNRWYNQVLEKTNYFENNLGQIHNIEIDGSQINSSIPESQITNIYETIELRSHNLLRHNNISKKALCGSVISVPTYNRKGINKTRRISTIKHISSIVDRQKEKLTGENKYHIANALANLGLIHAQYLKQSKKYAYLSVLTYPEYFLSIGKYKWDHNSCFGFGSCNQIDKFTMGWDSRGFIVLITQKPIESIQEIWDDNSCVISRCLGAYTPEIDKTVNLFNLYTEQSHAEFVRQSIVGTCKDIFFDNQKCEILENQQSIDGVYHNNYRKDEDVCGASRRMFNYTLLAEDCIGGCRIVLDKYTLANNIKQCRKCYLPGYVGEDIFTDPITRINTCRDCG